MPTELKRTSEKWRTSKISELPELLKWQHRQVLFAASVVALGYKLKPVELCSDEYYQNFSEKEQKFRNPNNRRLYHSLPQFDLLPKAQMDAALAAVQAAEKNPDELALQNSGSSCRRSSHNTVCTAICQLSQVPQGNRVSNGCDPADKRRTEEAAGRDGRYAEPDT